MADIKEVKRSYRHQRLRKKIQGTTDQPRLCVHRSLNNLQAQIIDDTQNKILFGVLTLDKVFRSKIKNGGNVKAADALGTIVAAKAQEKGIKKVCFDRGGYLYHGRVKAFAEAARKGGLEF